MDILYYWIMGLMIGFGIGTLLPAWLQVVCAVIGFIMSLLVIGWYGHKMWARIGKDTKERTDPPYSRPSDLSDPQMGEGRHG